MKRVLCSDVGNVLIDVNKEEQGCIGTPWPCRIMLKTNCLYITYSPLVKDLQKSKLFGVQIFKYAYKTTSLIFLEIFQGKHHRVIKSLLSKNLQTEYKQLSNPTGLSAAHV